MQPPSGAGADTQYFLRCIWCLLKDAVFGGAPVVICGVEHLAYFQKECRRITRDSAPPSHTASGTVFKDAFDNGLSCDTRESTACDSHVLNGVSAQHSRRPDNAGGNEVTRFK